MTYALPACAADHARGCLGLAAMLAHAGSSWLSWYALSPFVSRPLPSRSISAVLSCFFPVCIRENGLKPFVADRGNAHMIAHAFYTDTHTNAQTHRARERVERCRQCPITNVRVQYRQVPVSLLSSPARRLPTDVAPRTVSM